MDTSEKQVLNDVCRPYVQFELRQFPIPSRQLISVNLLPGKERMVSDGIFCLQLLDVRTRNLVEFFLHSLVIREIYEYCTKTYGGKIMHNAALKNIA